MAVSTKTSSFARWAGAAAAEITTDGTPVSVSARNSADRVDGVASSASVASGFKSAESRSRGSSSSSTALRAKLDTLARIGAGVRATGLLAGARRARGRADAMDRPEFFAARFAFVAIAGASA
ncbi:MAG TPA: hypothetical protein VML91_13920 [Burkholderiales bacterium]|nr:hypothetical protein [Burkholderiales bacterium]